MKNQKALTIAFVFPLVFLMGTAGLNEYDFRTGQPLVLPVEGHDPRDFLSGHYLIYKINYGLKCPPSRERRRTAYICFEPKRYITVSGRPENCLLFIKAQCLFNQKIFQPNIERYYIPEKRAKQIEKAFTQAEERSVVLSVTKRGRALVQDILIDGESLNTLLRR